MTETTPTPRGRSPMGMLNLLQQIIQQNELLKLQMVEQEKSFKLEIQQTREELNDAIIRGLQRPDVSDMMVAPLERPIEGEVVS